MTARSRASANRQADAKTSAASSGERVPGRVEVVETGQVAGGDAQEFELLPGDEVVDVDGGERRPRVEAASTSRVAAGRCSIRRARERLAATTATSACPSVASSARRSTLGSLLAGRRLEAGLRRGPARPTVRSCRRARPAAPTPWCRRLGPRGQLRSGRSGSLRMPRPTLNGCNAFGSPPHSSTWSSATSMATSSACSTAMKAAEAGRCRSRGVSRARHHRLPARGPVAQAGVRDRQPRGARRRGGAAVDERLRSSGFVDRDERGLFNAVGVCANGSLLGVYRKRRLPNYAVFDEQRYFLPGAEPLRCTRSPACRWACRSVRTRGSRGDRSSSRPRAAHS